MPLTRRHLLSATALFTLVGGGIAADLWPRLIGPAWADDTVPPADLAQAGADGDVVLGSDKAPVTIIEYASMNCPHCAHFTTTTYPDLKSRYIDTGKVRYILREFPLDQIAVAGSMLARCAGKDKYMSVVEVLFAKQPEWVVEEPLAAARGTGQAIRLHRPVLQGMLIESEARRRHPCRARSRHREARGQFDPDFFHQWQEGCR